MTTQLTKADSEFHRQLAAYYLAHLRFKTSNRSAQDLSTIPEWVPARIRIDAMTVVYLRRRDTLEAGEYDCESTLYGFPVVTLQPEHETKPVEIRIPVSDCEIVALAPNHKRAIAAAEQATQAERKTA